MREHSILVGSIIGFTIFTSGYVYNSNEFSNTQKTILLLMIIFPPLQWISILIAIFYNKSIRQNTPQEKESIKITDAVSNLSELKKSGLLTETEYNEKVSKLNIEKSELELKNTTEYKQLKNLFDVGVLNQDEFDDKINSLKKVLLDKTKQIENVPEKDNANYYYSDESYNDNIKIESFWTVFVVVIGLIVILGVIVIFIAQLL